MRNDFTLIGLTGRAGSGKDTAAQHLVQRYGFVSASFAAAPRSMLEALLEAANVDHAWLHERALKEQPMPIIGASYRHLMQTLGTEWGRGLVDADLWARVLACSLGLDEGGTPVHDRIVLTDVRYPNEADLVLRRGTLVGIVRPGAATVREHSSEAEVDRLIAERADHALWNTGSVAGLHDLVDGLAWDLGLDARAALPQGWGL